VGIFLRKLPVRGFNPFSLALSSCGEKACDLPISGPSPAEKKPVTFRSAALLLRRKSL